MTFLSFLEQKPLFYDEIDYERMPKAFQSIAAHFRLPKMIHVVGTNGKGTTGRFLARMLLENNVRVGHYTSPHILHFNERIWLNGHDVDDTLLEAYHQKLLSWLDAKTAEALSYFEYTTLLAMAIFCDHCDYVVLEAGLGGEFDATNTFPKILSLITPIGMDHQAFLGSTIQCIATTKLNSVQTDFVLAKQYEAEVTKIAKKRAKTLHVKMFEPSKLLDETTRHRIEHSAFEHGAASFLQDNFKTALCACRVLGFDIDLKTIVWEILPGRRQRVLPNVLLDVGHNVMAAEALLQTYTGRKIHLIYNSYKDKDYRTILGILRPIIETVHVIPIESPRALEEAALYEVANDLSLPIFPLKTLDMSKEYVAFGSFSVAEAFLKGYCER